jgi:hypothetical protein
MWGSLALQRAEGHDGWMKSRTASRLAWSLWGAYALATVAFILLGSLNGDLQEPLAANLPILFGFAAFAGIGGLLISRMPRHPIGWIFVTIGLGTAFGNLTQQYAIYALFTEPGSLPAGVAMGWLGAWLWVGSMATIVFVLLLYPDGNPVSPRWKLAVWAAGGSIAALLAPFMFKPGLLDLGENYPVANPLGIKGWDALFEVVQAAGVVVYLLAVVGGTIGLVIRAHRSKGVERQQLKWLGYAAVFLVTVAFIIGPLADTLLRGQVRYDLSAFLFGCGVAAIPAATGIAILRYRLYDIDLIINRTLVYATLTAVLSIVYLGGVVGVGGLVRGLTGQERNNLVIAASTLAVAGAFRPARTRIQAFIDRRFYRSKYDAQRTIADFSLKMREQIDLNSLTSELAIVVHDTVQPTHVSLWLRAR